MKHGGYALGANKLEVVRGISIPHAFSGIVSSFVLAISRAIGETMVVTIAAGARPTLTLNPLVSVQTLTSFIAQASQGDNPHGTTSYYALYAVGMLLFTITFSMNIAAHHIIRRRKEASS
jgi:phosphate transport system permease protein